jgi:hypothetical protein
MLFSLLVPIGACIILIIAGVNPFLLIGVLTVALILGWAIDNACNKK